MKKALPIIIAVGVLAIVAVLCVFVFSGGITKNEVPSTPQCNHVYSKGYCTSCKEMDPTCQKLTAENFEDYLDISYKIANVDGSTGGSTGAVAFPYLYLTATPTSSRITFYDVEVEIEFTVKLYLDSSRKFEECTVTAKIPISLFGEGNAKVRLNTESYDLVVPKSSYILKYKVVSIDGCVSVK